MQDNLQTLIFLTEQQNLRAASPSPAFASVRQRSPSVLQLPLDPLLASALACGSSKSEEADGRGAVFFWRVTSQEFQSASQNNIGSH